MCIHKCPSTRHFFDVGNLIQCTENKQMPSQRPSWCVAMLLLHSNSNIYTIAIASLTGVEK